MCLISHTFPLHWFIYMAISTSFLYTYLVFLGKKIKEEKITGLWKVFIVLPLSNSSTTQWALRLSLGV